MAHSSDDEHGIGRRAFLTGLGAAAVCASALPAWFSIARAAPTPSSRAEALVRELYRTLSADQKEEVAFPWNYQVPGRGLLRTYLTSSWYITRPRIRSDFYTAEQQSLMLRIYQAVQSPEWHRRFLRQMHDDADGNPWGSWQSMAMFGNPGGGPFQCVLTGRHTTLRADGNSAAHFAFGGPIFYGHAANGNFVEPVGHPGNVFWEQAQRANRLHRMLDGRQRALSLVDRYPTSGFLFRGRARLDGLPVSELSADQKTELRDVLAKLVEPFRVEDRDEVAACLAAQGGLDRCSLLFARQGDLGRDGIWDHWRLEGPAFVWSFRGTPHVHVFVNVADDPRVLPRAQPA